MPGVCAGVAARPAGAGDGAAERSSGVCAGVAAESEGSSVSSSMTLTGAASREAAGAGEPVNRSASSSGRRLQWSGASEWEEREDRTEVEEVDAGFVAADVEVVLEKAAALEAELREIVAAVIAKEQTAARFQ